VSPASFVIEKLPFNRQHVELWRGHDHRYRNWPVVYILEDGRRVYVGETLNVAARMKQHLESEARGVLKAVRLVLDDRFNKSACLDLESRLIGLFAADGKYEVLNSNKGVVDADYYDRRAYQETFDEIFQALQEQDVLTRTVPEIENSELFKLSPFKALNHDQAVAVEDVLEGLFADLETRTSSEIVVRGAPGTGKTVVAVHLAKLLRDIADGRDDVDADALFGDFFSSGHRELLNGFRLGLVVPQQALRASLRRVFQRTPGLARDMVLTPFDVGKSSERWDLLLVDEAHRLNQRANQASGPQNAAFAQINHRLFGSDGDHWTQLDWMAAQSDHQLYLLDVDQSVRPADLPEAVQRELTERTQRAGRSYPLSTQMRVRAGSDFVKHVRHALRGGGAPPPPLGAYDLQFHDDLGEMHDAIRDRDGEGGLARLVAGYAWEWKSKRDPGAVDIDVDGRQLQWNKTQKDWITSPGAVDQVGSIHTVQGYDLNYVGVMIGPDLRWDDAAERVVFDRSRYFDKKGMENNPRRGLVYSDDDLLRYVTNAYAVLLTRGIRGAYVYVCDPALRERLRPSFSRAVL